MSSSFLSRKWMLSIGVLLIFLSGIVGFWLVNVVSNNAHAANTLPFSATSAGPYSTQGNAILDVHGKPYLFHGMGRDGLEYSCTGDGPLDAQHLAFMGPGTSSASGTYWWGNTVRLPVSEGFWLHGAPGTTCTAAQYQALVKSTIDAITALKLNVIIDLHWVDAGGQSGAGGGPWPMPDADTVTFWQQVAPMYKSYSNVVFELFNEPHPATWSCWKSGCSVTDTRPSSDCGCSKTVTYQAIGMQAVVNAVRATGASNLIIAGGYNWSFDLSQLSSYVLSGSNIVYDTHFYPYSGKLVAQWDGSFGNISASYPVISSESGEYDCQSANESQFLTYLDSHQIGWIGWAWTVQGSSAICGYPQVITDYQGTPAASMGQMEYQHLLSYVPAGGTPTPVAKTPTPVVVNTPTPVVGTPTPVSTPVVGPPPAGNSSVSKTWYFAGGRVGAAYQEYVTMWNPSQTVDCPVNIQYLLQGGAVVPKTVLVPHGSHLTESVNQDLGISSNQAPKRFAGLSVSTILKVSASSACGGILADRSVSFSGQNIPGYKGSGAPNLGQSFYFVNSGSTLSLIVLNPPGGKAAVVTIITSASGHQPGTQTITLQPGTSSTITPNGATSSTHIVWLIKSSQPIMLEPVASSS